MTEKLVIETQAQGIRINVQRSSKRMATAYSPDEAVVSITVPAKSVTVELLDALMTLADQALIKEIKKWKCDKPLAMEELPPEEVKNKEDYIATELDINKVVNSQGS